MARPKADKPKVKPKQKGKPKATRKPAAPKSPPPVLEGVETEKALLDAPKPEAGKRGRPELFTPEIAAEICRRMADGETLTRICRDKHMPARSTVYLWLDDPVHVAFSGQYARARERQADYWGDESIEIADDGSNDWMERQQGETTIRVLDHEHIQRSKIRLEQRRWMMERLNPKGYGTKVEVDTPADGGIAKAAAVTMAALAGLAERRK